MFFTMDFNGLYLFFAFSILPDISPASVVTSSTGSAVNTVRIYTFDDQSRRPSLRCIILSGYDLLYISRFCAYFAFCSINSRRGSTLSPISREKSSSHIMASSTVTLSSVRVAGSIVVAQS